MIKALFFDLSGVLYEGEQVIPGAIEAVAKAQTSGMEVRFVTNSSRKTSTDIVRDLVRFGFDVRNGQIFTAPAAVKALLQAKNWRPYCLLHPALEAEFADLDHADPNAVFISDAEQGFHYQALDRAFQLCHAGAPLIGVGMNRYFRHNGQLHLDAGPFIKALEFASGQQAIIVGKPAAAFFRQVVASTSARAEQTLMIGDDVLADIEGALNAGLQACLVKTGKYQPDDENQLHGRFRCADSVLQAVENALSHRD